MKRIMSLMLVIVIIALSAGASFAYVDVGGYESVIEKYTIKSKYSTSSRCNLSVRGGKAYWDIVIVNSSTKYDYVSITSRLKKGTSNVTTCYNTVNRSGGTVSVSRSSTLSGKGSYHVEVTAKFYKGGKVVETINFNSATKTY